MTFESVNIHVLYLGSMLTIMRWLEKLTTLWWIARIWNYWKKLKLPKSAIESLKDRMICPEI